VLFLSCLVLSCLVLSFVALSLCYLVLSCVILSCLVLVLSWRSSCFVLSCLLAGPYQVSGLLLFSRLRPASSRNARIRTGVHRHDSNLVVFAFVDFVGLIIFVDCLKDPSYFWV
jgi:hypothetical protein